jgi:hypothetical protein
MIDLCEADSVKNAIIELKATKREWERKANLCCEMIAAVLADQIDANLKAIPYTDDLINLKTHQYERKSPDIYVMSQGNGVFVEGEEVVFIEFGAGVYHNESVNNPLSEAVQFETDIGSYGKGQGLQPYWFVAHNLISRGTPAYMPIYRAIIAIKPEIPTLVRQVFV